MFFPSNERLPNITAQYQSRDNFETICVQLYDTFNHVSAKQERKVHVIVLLWIKEF
jgi:hypothetical protein